MKTLIAALALSVTLIATPAFTQAPPTNDVIVGGQTIGDPDANVRLQLRRDAGSQGY